MSLSKRVVLMLLFALFSLLPEVPTSAQSIDEQCPAIVQQALNRTDTACQQTGRNEVCYGNTDLDVEWTHSTTAALFEAPGDMANVAAVRHLQLFPMDVEAKTWGTALMRLQANIPSSLPGQNVTFLLFGDVELEVASLPTLEIASGGGLNVRSGPSTGHPVIEGLHAGQTVTANGRNADGSWLRIILPNETTLTGWVFAELVSSEDATDTLEVVDTEDASNGGQAFYFRSGVGDAPCVEAPNSGLLVITPEGLGEVSFTLNEVSINLASTAFMQAEPGDALQINMIEGQGRFAAFGVEQIALSGMTVAVPIDNNRAAVGPPREPVRCVAETMNGLPVESWNCDNIEVHVPYDCPATIPFGMDIELTWPTTDGTEAEIDAYIASGTSALFIDGQPAPISRRSKYERSDMPGTYGYDTKHWWSTPEPGTHTITGTSETKDISCTLTVLDP